MPYSRARRSWSTIATRSASRCSWTAAAGHGFTTGAPWIAFGASAEQTAVDVEDADPSSMLTYYRQLLAFRRGHAVWGTGDVRLVAFDTGTVVSFVREDAAESYLVAVNLTDEEQEGNAADPLPGSGQPVFGDGALTASGGRVHVKIPARSSAVFRIR